MSYIHISSALGAPRYTFFCTLSAHRTGCKKCAEKGVYRGTQGTTHVVFYCYVVTPTVGRPTRTKSWSTTLAFAPQLTYDLLCSKFFFRIFRPRLATPQAENGFHYMKKKYFDIQSCAIRQYDRETEWRKIKKDDVWL